MVPRGYRAGGGKGGESQSPTEYKGSNIEN